MRRDENSRVLLLTGFTLLAVFWLSGCNPLDRSNTEIFFASEAVVGPALTGQGNGATSFPARTISGGEEVPFQMYPCGEKKEFSSWKELSGLYDRFTRQLPNGQVFTDYEPGFRSMVMQGTTLPFEKRVVDLATAMSSIPPSERTQAKFEQALATFPSWAKPKPGHFTVEYEFLPERGTVAVRTYPGTGGNIECMFKNFWLGSNDYGYYDWPVRDTGQYAPGSDRWDYQNRPLPHTSENDLSQWFMPAVVHFYIYMGRTPATMEELLDFYELEKNLDYPGIWNTLRFESWETGARISYRLPTSAREVVTEVELADKNRRFLPNWP